MHEGIGMIGHQPLALAVGFHEDAQMLAIVKGKG
jgi:hypothetical protein